MIKTKTGEAISKLINRPYELMPKKGSHGIDCLSMVDHFIKDMCGFSLEDKGLDPEECYRLYKEDKFSAFSYGTEIMRSFMDISLGKKKTEGDILIVTTDRSMSNYRDYIGISIYAGFNRMFTVYENIGSSVVNLNDYDTLEVFQCHKLFL